MKWIPRLGLGAAPAGPASAFSQPTAHGAPPCSLYEFDAARIRSVCLWRTGRCSSGTTGRFQGVICRVVVGGAVSEVGSSWSPLLNRTLQVWSDSRHRHPLPCLHKSCADERECCCNVGHPTQEASDEPGGALPGLNGRLAPLSGWAGALRVPQGDCDSPQQCRCSAPPMINHIQM